MSLNLPTEGGGGLGFLRYNSKAGRWYVRAPDGNQAEVVKPRLAIDLDNIKTGWICFPGASPPLFVWDVNGQRQPRPAPIGGTAYKVGFEVLVYGTAPQECLNGQSLGLRQWTSNAYVANAGVKKAYDQYEANKVKNPDMVPVFICERVEMVRSQGGDNFEPVLILERWVERARIPGLDEAEAARSATTATPDRSDEGGDYGPDEGGPLGPEPPPHDAPF